ncbi:Hypothetical Protein FCC1311_108462 [Hondaea fermentalgiana]|uniref:Serrate RNA effector molecule-like n=1 Tax=Hondaea fermentalgiana TaxID=2315210 RepID=A0A2R5H2K2_9STRA|nr:Hypothetical Protein FCC1311_108462 [Hondaea fermentalgiana]|eukprot:GBG34624.1 Hypothetical Protein FCC1311_108462 [Hondaea fermentalgiana]
MTAVIEVARLGHEQAEREYESIREVFLSTWGDVAFDEYFPTNTTETLSDYSQAYREDLLSHRAGYQAYVQGWQAKQASDYFDTHGTEEWFLNRYDVTRVAALEESICQHASVEAARMLAEAKQDKLEALCPVLDAVPESGRKPKIAKAIGDPLADKHVIFLPRVPPAVTFQALTSAVREALASSNVSGGDGGGAAAVAAAAAAAVGQNAPASFSLLLGEPLLVDKHGGSSRKNSGRNLFNRDAWVAFDTKESADALRSLGKLQAKATPVTPGAEPETVELSVLERRLLGNRFAFKEVSSPARIKIDLHQAHQVALLLDQARGVETGINALLKSEPVQTMLDTAADNTETEKGDKEEDVAEATSDYASEAKELRRERRELDVILGYLRHVHLTCYYGHRMYVSAGEMAQLNMLPYLRHFPTKEAREAGWKDIADARAKANSDANQGGDEEKAEGEEDQKKAEADADKPMDADAKFFETLKTILEPRKSTYLRNVDEAVASWLKRFAPEKVQAEREVRAAKLDRAKELMTKAEEDFCKTQTRFEEKGKYRCLLPPFKRFASEEFVHKHIRTKQVEQLNAARVKAVRELIREEFLGADDKPLPPLPDYAKPKDRSYYKAHFGDGTGAVVADGSATPSMGMGGPQAQQPRKFRTVIDYSDI